MGIETDFHDGLRRTAAARTEGSSDDAFAMAEAAATGLFDTWTDLAPALGEIAAAAQRQDHDVLRQALRDAFQAYDV
ncbi:hypothetical protein [uncultured Albimonas sp.]|uniref:hypothetical protein n=1 Tax=uncultured Albimonas sp. TaxID=1331701 RepID=UPI0030EDB5AB|tara:strand:- start:3706 stop:3936 length:231 start_codon:yes stop_codon:yes gene_type:complete